MKSILAISLFACFVATSVAFGVQEWGRLNYCGRLVYSEVEKVPANPYGVRKLKVNYPNYVSLKFKFIEMI